MSLPSDTDIADPRIGAIRDLIGRLASGQAGVRGEPSGLDDGLDAVIVGLNQLAEELDGRAREHAAAMESLRLSEERFQLAMGGANDGLWDWEPPARRCYYSPRWKAMIGYAEEEIGDSPDEWESRLHPDDALRVKADLRRCLEGLAEQFESRYRLQHKEGGWVSVLSRGRIFFDAKGRPVRMVGTHVDVTEQVALERALGQAREELEQRFEERTRALAESEARYRHLWEHLNDAAFIADAETGRLLETNQRGEALLGRPRCEILGRDLSILHPQDRADEYRNIFRKAKGGTFHDMEVITADGRIVVVDISMALTTIQGRPLALGLFRDVTERKAMNRELEFMQFAVDRAGDAIFWIDSGYRFVGVNQSACRTLGYSSKELIGMPVSVVAADCTLLSAGPALANLERQGAISFEAVHRRKDGHDFPVEVTANYFRYGERDYICAIARDISGRRLAARAIAESDANLNALAENASDGIIIAQDYHPLFVNQAYARMVGYSMDELMALETTLDLIHPAERPRIESFVASRMKNEIGTPTRYETVLLHKNGSPLPVEVNVTPTTWSGTPAKLLVIRDVSARKRYEGQLRENAAMLRQKTLDLERVNIEREQLLYVMAHDLKGPLRAVSQLSSVIEEEMGGLLPDEPRHLLRILRGRVQRMHGLIEALLAYTRAHHIETIEWVDCRQLVAALVNDLQLPSAFRVEIGAHLPAFETDAVQLRQVFANLIGNAVRHHDRAEGKIVIDCQGDGPRYLFSVTDDGPGVPPQYRERIFQLFQTLVQRDIKESNGMGLALARKLVESQGGRIMVESTGRGSSFRFTWPKHIQESDAGSVPRP